MRRMTAATCLILILMARAAMAADAAFPVPVIEMSGSGEAMGQAHAKQLGEPIRNLFHAYFGKYFQNEGQKNLSMMAATAFRPHVAAEHRAEIASLANGVGLDEREVMLGQCFLDLSAITACSTVTLPAAASPDDAALISTNHHRGTDLDTSGRCRRYDYLHDTSAKDFGRVTRQGVQAMMGEAAQGNMTLQSMVFEPSNRVIYLAVGKNAPKQGYHKLELAKYFATSH